MNGLNSPALHVGVDLFLLLAEIDSVLKELSCDWPGRLGSVGVFYRWWKWDTLWHCSLSIFHWGCRGYECAAESLSLLAVWGSAAYGPCVSQPKLAEAYKTPRGIYILFFLNRTHSFCFKGSRLRKWASMAFFADTLAFLPGICPSM